MARHQHRGRKLGRFGALLLLLFESALLPAGAGAATYTIDPQASGLIIYTEPAGLFKRFGYQLTIGAPKFSGTIQFEPQNPKVSSLKINVKATSLVVKSQVTDKDRENIEIRMHENMLESHLYPDVTYVSQRVGVKPIRNNVYDLLVEGNLTLHGVTRPFSLPAVLTLKPDRVEATGEVTLNQRDFKIKPYMYQGGALRVADQVRLSFNIVAKR